jgi:cation diffusion facilitator family transporter
MTPHEHTHDHDHDHGHGHGHDHGHAHAHLRGEITTFAAAVSIGSNLFLTAAKLSVGVWMGSAAVISEGIHSATDLLASFSAYFSVRMSSRPANEAHPYGHGKYEDLAAVFEASLIVFATVGVVWKAVTDFSSGHGPEKLEFGMGIMVLSILVNTAVSRYLFRTAKETDSVALEADAWHLSADVLTSVGVLVGLGMVALTGVKMFDPIAALLVGLYILVEAYRIGRTGLRNLLDSRLPEHEVAAIEQVLAKFTGPTVKFHGVRTRKSGPERHIDLHLVVLRSMPTGDAHDLCHQVEDALKSRFPGAWVLIHLESAELLLGVQPRAAKKATEETT